MGAPQLSDPIVLCCPMQQPSQMKNILVVTDTFINKNFKLKTIESKIIFKEGGFTEYRNVVCDELINADLINSIKSALSRRGYSPGELDGVYDHKTKAALVKFQKDNNLPIGQLDEETIIKL